MRSSFFISSSSTGCHTTHAKSRCDLNRVKNSVFRVDVFKCAECLITTSMLRLARTAFLCICRLYWRSFWRMPFYRVYLTLPSCHRFPFPTPVSERSLLNKPLIQRIQLSHQFLYDLRLDSWVCWFFQGTTQWTKQPNKLLRSLESPTPSSHQSPTSKHFTGPWFLIFGFKTGPVGQTRNWEK